MATTDWYNTNEHIKYPFCPYDEEENGINTKDVVDCQFFMYNAPSAMNGTDSVWLSEKEETDNELKLTFKCTDTTENSFKPLIFDFIKSTDWQGKWVRNDDWYGFVAIGSFK